MQSVNWGRQVRRTFLPFDGINSGASHLGYSYLSDSTGSTLAARRAGEKPARNPIVPAKEPGLLLAWSFVSLLMKLFDCLINFCSELSLEIDKLL